MKRQIFTFALPATVLLAVSGCKKDSTEPPASADPTPITVTLNMNWMLMNGTTMFTAGTTVLNDSLGHALKLDSVRFFVSEIHALNDDHQAIGHFEDAYQLVNSGQAGNFFAVGTMTTTESEIHSFTFDLGLDATANAGNPATAAPPLNDASMHFTGAFYSMGYKIVEVSGHADLDGNGTFETALHFECGMNDALTPVEVHVHHDITNGEVYSPMIHADLGTLFNGINLAATPTGDMHSAQSMRLISNLAAGITAM